MLNSDKNKSPPSVESTAKKIRKSRTIVHKQPNSELVQIFWAAPNEAFFGQETIAPVIQRSIKSLESDRWRGQGIPFRKCLGRVVYKKSDVIAWIENHALVTSTSEYNKEVNHGE
ncbi:MAG: hypothetical protein EBQ95_07520 [Gammaproteobacteria bacterium]|nr:hypothetical protein [Gammaproteobacteria bacterium]